MCISQPRMVTGIVMWTITCGIINTRINSDTNAKTAAGISIPL